MLTCVYQNRIYFLCRTILLCVILIKTDLRLPKCNFLLTRIQQISFNAITQFTKFKLNVSFVTLPFFCLNCSQSLFYNFLVLTCNCLKDKKNMNKLRKWLQTDGKDKNIKQSIQKNCPCTCSDSAFFIFGKLAYTL